MILQYLANVLTGVSEIHLLSLVFSCVILSVKFNYRKIFFMLMNFLRRLLGGRKCKKLVKWQGRTLKLSAEVGGEFSISNLEIDQKQLNMINELADTLDHHQYQMCLDYQHIGEEKEEFKNYLKKRDEIRNAFSLLRSTLVAYQSNPRRQKSALDFAVKNMQKVLAYTELEKGNYNKAKQKFDEILKPGSEESVTNIELLKFYEKLSDYLEITRRMFTNQAVVRSQLVELLKKRFDISGDQYESMFERLHKEMKEQELNKFNFIRKITEDLAEYNHKMFELLDKNQTRLNDDLKIRELHDHLQFWGEKYESLIDNPHMALVYTGVPEELGGEGKPFPRSVETFVSNKIKELRQQK